MTKPIDVAVVGATGAVGKEMIEILQERDFPVSNLTLFSSSRSAGRVYESLRSVNEKLRKFLGFPPAPLAAHPP